MDEITLYILALRGYTPAPDLAVITDYDGRHVRAMVVRMVPRDGPPTTSPPENFALHIGPPAEDREAALKGLLTVLETTAERPGRLVGAYRVRPASVGGTAAIEGKGLLRGPSYGEMQERAVEVERAQKISWGKLQHA